MKRWRLALLLAILACVPVLVRHSFDPGLLLDSDTQQMISVIRQRQSPLSWFAGDWPLANHFYRPLPTLSFELDDFLYGDRAAGYGWTNAILAALSVLALFWFLRELIDSPPFAVAGAALFAVWTVDWGPTLALWCYLAAPAIVVIGFFRHGLGGRFYLPTAFTLVFLGTQVAGEHPLAYRIVEWLPGRTASLMTVFVLISMAAYARYERTTAPREFPPPTALDPPTATRSSDSTAIRPFHAWRWIALAVVALVAALASYEQAVMLPACLLVLAVYFRLSGRSPRWRIHVGFWVILIAYLVFRHFVIPPGVSRYQNQQVRFGPQAWIDLLDYGLPNVGQLWFIIPGLSGGVLTLLATSVSGPIMAAISTATTFFTVGRHWRLVLTGLALSTIAFLPMAFLKFFAHYHDWPMALRTVFVVGLVRVAWDWVSIAACLPSRQAPPRLEPAPGSLPRP